MLFRAQVRFDHTHVNMRCPLVAESFMEGIKSPVQPAFHKCLAVEELLHARKSIVIPVVFVFSVVCRKLVMWSCCTGQLTRIRSYNLLQVSF